ncbi:MAG: acyltransferase domain-containing protein [Burkholderiales bacterium]|nr:acyltransferase domain-containing protein [Burkholderiales bacterium]
MNDIASNERILQALRDARRKLEAVEESRDGRVAVIGMAGRFPGADDLAAFWQLLQRDEAGIRFLSDDELLAAGEPRERFERADYVRAWASFTAPGAFDATFFGYAPREAEILDPQQRVFLECAWSALEDAGYDSSRHDGAIGVFAGAALNGYVINLHADAAVRDSVDDVQAVVGNVLGLMPTRVSYHLDLRGPSVGIQTGCSTSLVAIHSACRSLIDGECDMALAGGVTVGEVAPRGYLHRPGGIASPDGVCRAFDAQGQGTVFGNGVGVVVLKRLPAAVADGDHIYAVIRGSAVNNDGADKVGLIAPSVGGQAAVIRAALQAADVNPATLGYIEAHGTGTDLGDPIELAALHKVLKPAFERTDGRCAIGSVKTHVGHLDAAAGVAGFIKAALALRHEALPPSLNFRRPNPDIDFSGGPLFVNTALTPWPRRSTPRRAGVSSFGMGGTNAHAILEEAPLPAIAEPMPERGWHLLPLSARTPSALEAMTQRLRAHLRAHPDANLADVAHTLQVGRRAFPHRRVLVCRSVDDAIALLDAGDGPRRFTGAVEPGPRPVAFLVPGQGSQQVGMARALYDAEPVFRAALDRCAALLGARVPLLELLYPVLVNDAVQESLRQTDQAQPVLFAIEYALAQLWLSWGVHPQALLGHSIGEYVAACVAGVVSLEDALHLVTVRGELMQRCAPGRMMAVMLAESDLRALLPTDLEVAAINGPTQCVVSGPQQAVVAFREALEGRGVVCHALDTSHAFHSAMMAPALDAFAAAVRAVSLQPPQRDVVSNVTGGWLTAAEAVDPDYWVRHLRHAVRFGDGLATVRGRDDPICLEVGPGTVLSGLARPRDGMAAPAIASLPDPVGGQGVAVALARLWQAGATIDWVAYQQGRSRRRVPLPTYPFERQQYWIPRQTGASPQSVVTTDDDTGNAKDPSDWFHLPTWRGAPLIAPMGSANDACWLIFADAELHAQLQRRLPGIDLIPVRRGAAFDAGTGDYALDPAMPDDYHRLFEAVLATGRRPTQALVLWTAGPSAQPGDAFDVALHVAQAAMASDLAGPITLSFVTAGAYRVSGHDAVDPAAATVLGLCQAADQESTLLRCRHIDVESGAARFADRVIDDLVRECATPWDPAARLVALRDGMRWVRDHRPLPLPPVDRPPALLRERGVYLIAGDLVEGLGMIYAQALHRDCRARLVLVGRAGLPSADAWEHWLATHGPRHPVSALIRRLQQLRNDGAELLFFSGPLADPRWMNDTLAAAVARFGAIDGVFHNDVMGDHASCMIAQTSADDRARIFRSKVQGIDVLAEALRSSTPDFVVLQSSLSSIVGGVGFAAYGAANAYRDALAAGQRGDTPWIAINWDACHQDDLPGDAGAPSALLAAALTPVEVWQATLRILAQPRFSQVIVSPRSLPARLAEAFDPEVRRARQQSVAAPATAGHGRPDLTTAYIEPRTPTERMVARAMGDLLGIAQVGADDDFFELGGHSLLAIQAVTRLRKEFGVELPMRARQAVRRHARSAASRA